MAIIRNAAKVVKAKVSSDILKCKNCRWWRSDGGVNSGRGDCCKYHPKEGRWQTVQDWFCKEFEFSGVATAAPEEVRTEVGK